MIYTITRKRGGPKFRCKACKKDFSLTSTTIFRYAKMPPEKYEQARHLVAGGKNARQIATELGVQGRTAWLLVKKIQGEKPDA